jgi:hypothetical protein
METNSIENLRAQMKCLQSEIFDCLRKYIKVYSSDADLRKISSQKYYDQDFTKSTVGVGGEINYGVICDYDPAKRNQIVEQIMQHVENIEGESAEKYSDIMVLTLTYIKLGEYMETVHLPSAMKNHIKNGWNTLNAMYVRIDKYAKNLN